MVREANAVWVSALADHLAASGMPAARAQRAVVLLDAAFMGFRFDLPLDTGEEARAAIDQAVGDLADAVAAIADPV